jgi:hypothetical protein
MLWNTFNTNKQKQNNPKYYSEHCPFSVFLSISLPFCLYLSLSLSYEEYTVYITDIHSLKERLTHMATSGCVIPRN